MAEESPNILSRKKQIVGNSVGLLSAAAVSSFSDLPSFLPLSVQHVKIAFRLGAQADAVSERISSTESKQISWSRIVPGVSQEAVEEVLVSFHKQSVSLFLVRLRAPRTYKVQGISAIKSAYVSSVGPPGVTISGPPDTLANLFESSSLRSSRPVNVEAYGAYNASHLYGNLALREVLSFEDEESKQIIADANSSLPVYSPSTGSEYAEDSFSALLKQVVSDILTTQAHSSAVLRQCASAVRDVKCRVVPIGPSLDAETTVSNLQQNGVEDVSLFETALGSVQRRGTGNHKSSKIAIVGMSGRFPGGQDIHEFWEMLQKGLDMHKEVRENLWVARFCSFSNGSSSGTF